MSIEMVYSRLPTNLTLTHHRTSDIAVSRAILERLERLEQVLSSTSRSTASGSQAASITSHSTTVESTASSLSPDFSSPGDNDGPGDMVASPSPVLTTTSLPPADKFDAVKSAVDEARKRIVRSCVFDTVHGENIVIPKELAKSWVNDNLEYTMGEPFPSLMNPKLLRLLPEIIDFQQVHMDPATMLTYYYVLHQGASMGRDKAHMEGDWLKKLYTCCIRALARWQHKTTGSPEDFYAAVLMRRVALETFDQDLAWILFEMACQYAQTLQLHQLDRPDGAGSPVIGKPILDQDRTGLWDLV
ncbi:hypothetical protein CEP54_013278 [Fusarium duplospermum]|uniref:Uncharacterized protein n=1 Tax=Fusarium duplospermum TaxID=1325734 RepID=A0A428P3S4_9HYPO|nr:hypothetical protein CEP54_013278 [Fusarium duplospermum]